MGRHASSARRAPLRTAGHRAARAVVLVAGVALLAGVATPAAADLDLQPTSVASAPAAAGGPPHGDATTVSLGIAAGFRPAFEGADENEVTPVPLVTVRNLYGFNVEGMALSYDLVRWHGTYGPWEVRLGPSLSLDFGRDEDDSDFLDGLGDIDTGVLAGGFLQFRYGLVMLNVSGGQDVADGHGGALIATRLGVMVPLSEDLRVSPGVSATWASTEYMQSYFGVTGRQAAGSIYTPFAPDAGFKDVGLTLNARYAIFEGWSVTGMLSYERLVGDAADSPIVQGPGGSEGQLMGLIGVAYAFGL